MITLIFLLSYISSKLLFIVWAMSWQILFIPYVNNKDADQPAHLHSLISVFIVCCLDSIIPVLAKSKISRLQLISVAEPASLCLAWSQTLKTGFLLTRLIHEFSMKPDYPDKEFLFNSWLLKNYSANKHFRPERYSYEPRHNKMCLFRVSDQARHKLTCSATESS